MAQKQVGATPSRSDDAVTKGYVDSAQQTLTNKTLSAPVLANPTLTNYTETLVLLGVVGAAVTLDLTSGTVQSAVLSSNVVTVFTMPTPVAGKSFTLYLRQPISTGGYGSASFYGVKWPANTAPTITVSPGRMDILTFVCDGLNWFGSYVQNFDSGEGDVSAGARTAVAVPNASTLAGSRPLRTLQQVIRRGRR